MAHVTQTAGRDTLGNFAPSFAHYNDDILFGENWNDLTLTHKQRCLLTVVALVSSGVTDSSLTYHLTNAKQAGVERIEIAATLTHIAFYVGWPKAWAAFHQAKEVWKEAPTSLDAKTQHEATMIFPVGDSNDTYAQYFSGKSYLAQVAGEPLPIYNVTFEPGCTNNWHIHDADHGGGQLLICVGGHGLYQAWGEDAVELHPGDSVTIPPGVKHWHGATENSWFSHLAIELPGDNSRTTWLESVDSPRKN